MDFPIKKAIILAGGKGTRLYPLTYDIPKPLIPMQGRTLTELVLDILKKYEIKDVVLSVGYLAEKMQEYFKDGKEFGVNINYCIEKEPKGTAGPLILLPKFEETFLMMNGDNLFNLDFEKFYKTHKDNKAIATIALSKVEDTSSFGVVELDGQKIINFVQKPKQEDAPSNFISSGYYILEPEVFDLVKNKEFAMLEKDVFPQLAEQGKLFGYYDSGQWFDTGTPERYEQANKEWRLE